jgi:hypothetical protein
VHGGKIIERSRECKRKDTGGDKRICNSEKVENGRENEKEN